MNFISGCSGIEAASVAFSPLGWEALAFAEIDPFASILLAQRWGATRPRFMPDPEAEDIDAAEVTKRRAAIRAVERYGRWGNHVPNFGDFTRLRDDPIIGGADVLCAGTPCQSFSFAGLRHGLADARGNLTLEFVRLADAADAIRIPAGKPGVAILWENVPGVLSSKDNAFGCFLGALVGDDAPLVPGHRQRWTDAGLVIGPKRAAAWRVLDAQFFGLAQRRERVFVVSCAGDLFNPAEILFERKSVPGNTRPNRPAPSASAAAGLGAPSGGGLEPLPVLSSGQGNAEITYDMAPTLTCLHEAPIVAIPVQRSTAGSSQNGDGVGRPQDPAYTLDTTGLQAVAFSMRGRDGENMIEPEPDDLAPALRTGEGGSSKPFVAIAFQERGREGGRVVETSEELAYALRSPKDGGQRDGNCVAAMFKPSHYTRGKDGAPMDISPALSADADKGDQDAVVFVADVAATLRSGSTSPAAHNKVNGTDRAELVAMTCGVRRLTPRECDRLQGFEDDYTLIEWGTPAKPEKVPADVVRYYELVGFSGDALLRAVNHPDGPRYRVLGNSWPVPVVRWLGRRLDTRLRAYVHPEAV